MKIFDGHVHLFNEKVINNVRLKKALVQQLKLQTEKVENRTRVETLVAEMQATGVAGALILPTANVGGVQKINRKCIDIAARTAFLFTAGTLHPDDLQYEQEMAYLRQHQVRIIKMCFPHEFNGMMSPLTHKSDIRNATRKKDNRFNAT